MDTVIEAIEGLTVLGHLKKDANRYAPSKGRNFVQLNVTQQKKVDVIEDHSLTSRQIINHLSEEALMAVDHRCFASNVEILKELYADINAAFERLIKIRQKLKTMTVFLKCRLQQSTYSQRENSMKAIILITTVFLSQLSLAGTGGGGVTMRTTSSKQPQIVCNIGKQDGLVKFAYGQLVDQKWQIQNIEIPESELITDLTVVKALQDSKALNAWTELK